MLSCSRLRGTQGAGPELERKFGPWPTSVARDLGFKVVRPLAEGFRARRPSTPRQTHVQVKRMSDVSCDIWDLECHQCRQTILGDGKAFPPHQHARHATTFNTIRIFMTSEGYYRSLLTHMTTRWLGLSPATHSCTSIIPWYKQLN